MKKLLILLILALAGCVAYVAISGGSSAAADRIAFEHYKCYQARHAKRATRFIPQTVFLTDQFRDNVEVNVIKLNTHCSEADQDLNPTPRAPGSAGRFERGLDCYTIRDAPRQPRFRPQNVDVLDKLTRYQQQTLTVSKAQNLCVPSSKGKFSGTLEGEGFICYQAKTAKGQPRFEQRNISIQDQFDDKLVRVIRPVAYCALTEKKIDAPNDDFDSGGAGNLSDQDFLGHRVLERHSSTVHATLEPNDPIVSCKTNYTNSVWYHWTSSSNYSLTVDTYGSSYDTVLAVFSGDKGPPWQEVGCNDNAVNGCSIGGNTGGCQVTFSSLQFDATANTTYHILVGSSADHGGKLKFRIEAKPNGIDACAENPFASRINQLTFVGDSRLYHYSTMNALPAGFTPSPCPSDAPTVCSQTPEHTVWFNYTVPSNQTQDIRFDASASSYDTLVAVFDNTILVDCGKGSVIASPLLAGKTYHVMVGDVDPNHEGGKLKLRYTLEGFIAAGSQAGVGVGAEASPNSITCYQVRQARHQTENEQVFDQFSIRQLDDPWLLTIGGVDSICVPSTKTTCTRFIVPDGETASLCEPP